MTEVTDELDDSPILEEVLGDALVKLRIFHDKLAQEESPADLSDRVTSVLSGNDIS